MAALPAIALAASAVGGVVSAMGTLAAGQSAKDASYFKAAQEDQAAQESRAASQRQALEKRRQSDLALSKIQAGAAASGAGASDPGIVNLSGDVAARGEYQALTDMYTGENRARGLEDQAMGDRMTGDAAETGAKYKAVGTLLDSGSSFYGKYKQFYG